MSSIGRKSWLVLLLLSVGFLSNTPYSLARWQPIPITGMEVPGLVDLDRLMTNLMARYGVIDGALAVARDGRLVYARGARMQIGHTLPHERVPGEVRYYDVPGAPLVPSVYPPHQPIPRPYSAYLEGVESGGGWIASTIDLLRFVTAVNGQRAPALLNPETVALMVARPDRPDVMNAPVYYGMGWLVRQASNGVEWRHSGSLVGSHSLLVRRADGVAWAVVFNSEPLDGFLTELDQSISRTLDEVKEWPAHDLFGTIPMTSNLSLFREFDVLKTIIIE